MPGLLDPLGNGSSSLVGSVGSEYYNQQGLPPESPAFTVLHHLPSAWASAGWNSWRGSRTILRGGFDEGLAGKRPLRRVGRSITTRLAGEEKGFIRQFPSRMRNSFTPKAFGRYSNQNMLYDDELSPLNIAAHMSNRGVNSLLRGMMNREGSSPKASKTLEKLRKMDILDAKTEASVGERGSKEELISRGFFARMHAGQKLARDEKISPRRMRSVSNFLSKDRSGLGKAVNFSESIFTGQDYSHLVGMSMKGNISQYAMGYVRTAASGPASEAVREVGNVAQKKAYFAGAARAEAAMENIGAEKIGGRLVAKEGGKLAEKGLVDVGKRVGLKAAFEIGGKEGAALVAAQAVPGLNVAVDALATAMMVYDVSKMGVGLMKSAVQTASDAGKSFKGSIEKGVMGTGYRDNTVAATSRQRGVMAIQASQLNARSVLGSEAAAIHGHFG